ncbi:MAG: T9SS type A sorting domain-containing protein, partial [Ferruginibacter sp.]
SGYYQFSNNSIVGSFRNNAAVAGTMYFYYTTFLNSQSVNGSSVIVTGNDFSNVIVNGATPIWGWHDLDGVSVFNAPSKTYTNNTISNISSGTGTIVGMYMTNSGQIACSTNVVSNITTGGNMVGIWHGSTNGQGVHYISSNSINNLNSSTGNVVGIMAGASNVPALHISDNNINALSSAAVNGQIVGIEIIQGPLININDNVINNVQGSGTGNPFAYGIRVNTGTLVNVFRNKIYDIRQTANLLTAIPGVIGIHSLNPTNLNIYNNFLSDLKAPNSGQADAIRGININAFSINTSYNLYYNSIYINAASTGTNFGSSGIYHTGNATATTGRLEMIDNIIVNTSTANGTGVSTAYRRSNATLTNYSAASDYNLFYAGTPSANSLIYYDGTNADQTLAAYQARVAARDANAVSLLPVFVSATDLHLVPGSNCAIDGRGTPVGGIFTDIDNDTRDAITPDIGADEFTAVYAPTLAGIVGIGVCENKNVSPTGTTYATAICERIAYILPSGAVPLTGTVNTCVTLDASQQYFNGEPYVQRHYDIDPATNAATATATITLYFTDAEFVTYNTNNPVWPTLPTMAGGGNADPNRANVKITQFHGTATTSPSSPGNYTGLRILIVPALPDINWNGTYWEITFNVTGFSGFYVHTNSFGTPLPITINYLKGYKQGNAHVLNWKVTCNSTASATMILERRADGGNFTAINSITADATRCRQPFDYTDTDPLNGMNYYRLKITDSDGKITYSTTVALLNAVKGYGIISLAPNPVVDDRFTLNISSAISSKIDLIIIDVSGRLIKKQMVNLIAGFNAVPVEVGKLAAGTYYVYGIAGGEKSKPVRFVIR